METITKKRLTIAMVILGLVVSVAAAAGVPSAQAAPKSEISVIADAPAPIDLNEASVEELVRVKGIGPALAERIVDHRTNDGPFESLDDLSQIRGIGKSRLNQIKTQVTL